MSDYHTDEPEALCPELDPFNDAVKRSSSQ